MRDTPDVHLIMRAMMCLYEQYLEPVRLEHGLSRMEITIISFLHNKQGHHKDTAGDIVELRMVPKGNVSRGVESLVNKGLLRRTPDSIDRRRIHLSLEPAAEPLTEAIEHSKILFSEQLFYGFSTEEKEKYLAYTKRMMANIEADLERK